MIFKNLKALPKKIKNLKLKDDALVMFDCPELDYYLGCMSIDIKKVPGDKDLHYIIFRLKPFSMNGQKVKKTDFKFTNDVTEDPIKAVKA